MCFQGFACIYLSEYLLCLLFFCAVLLLSIFLWRTDKILTWVCHRLSDARLPVGAILLFLHVWHRLGFNLGLWCVKTDIFGFFLDKFWLKLWKWGWRRKRQAVLWNCVKLSLLLTEISCESFQGEPVVCMCFPVYLLYIFFRISWWI